MMRVLLAVLVMTCGALERCHAMDLLTKPMAGEWTSDLWGAKAYAEQNRLPMFAVWTVRGASCDGFKAALETSAFRDLMKQYKIVYAYYWYGMWADTPEWRWCSSDGEVCTYPACRFYWPQEDGSVISCPVDVSQAMFADNIFFKDSVAARLVSRLKDLLSTWSGAPVPPPKPVSPPPPVRSSSSRQTWRAAQNAVAAEYPAWASSRTFQGVIVDGANPVGLCKLRCGKVNKKGMAKVSGKLQFFDGRKSVSLRAQSVTVADTVSVSWSAGETGLSILSDTFSGTAGDLRLASADLGGDVTGAHALVIERLTNDDGLVFEAEGKKWLFAATELIRKSKLSYNPKTALFKGTLKLQNPLSVVEGLPRKSQPRSLRVNGIVIDGSFYGFAGNKGYSFAVR